MHRRDDRYVFLHRHDRAGKPAIRYNRGRLVDVGDRESDRLGVGQGPVGRLDIDLVDIVAVGICRCFEVGLRNDRENAVLRVDGEARRVRTADDPVGDGCVFGILRDDHARHGRTFRQCDGRGAVASHRCDDRRLVDVRDGDRERRLGGQAAGIRRPHDNHVRRIGFRVEDRTRRNGQRTRDGIDQEPPACITARDEAVGQRIADVRVLSRDGSDKRSSG